MQKDDAFQAAITSFANSIIVQNLVEWAIAMHGMYKSPFVLEMFVL